MIQLGMHFDPSAGGVDRYFNGLLSGLADDGVVFRAAAFGELCRAGTFKDQSSSLGSRNMPLAKRLLAIRHLMSQGFPTASGLLVSHFALYASPVLTLARRPQHVVHFHGPWAQESQNERQRGVVVAAKKAIETRVYRSASRFVVLSQAFRDLLCTQYGVDEQRISIVPGGVDTDRFVPRDRAAARARLGWSRDQRIVLCVRRLVHRMGLESLIDAFRKIAGEVPNTYLFIAGKGPLEAALRGKIDELGLGDQVRLLGFVSDEDLPFAYAAADLSIVPSEALEGFGLTTLESLACGTPVLVTPIGGLPETVSGLSGDLVLSDASSEGIAAGLTRALLNPETLPQRGVCRDYAKENFSWSRIARRVNEVYAEVKARNADLISA